MLDGQEWSEMPGARPDSISRGVAEELRCAVVAPGANVPYGPGAFEVLGERGILAVPDFLSNSGGVHLYESVAPNMQPEAALPIIEAAVRESVARTLATSDELGITSYAAAFREARDYLARETRAGRELLDELFPT